MGFWEVGGCDVMTCILNLPTGMSPWKTLPSLFRYKQVWEGTEYGSPHIISGHEAGAESTISPA